MYSSGGKKKDKQQYKMLEPGVGLAQRKKLSVKLKQNELFDVKKKSKKSKK
jgi:hypothetical protein